MQGTNAADVRVARIGKPHGIRGEVTVEVFTDSPETRFTPGIQLTVEVSPAATQVAFDHLTVEKARWNKKILLLKFEEFSDRNTAEALRDSELYAPAVNPLDQDEGWYAQDLMGMAVHETSASTSAIGEVTDLITGSAQDLLEITLADGNEVLLPFVEEIVPEIDEVNGVVIITPPPGLLELNQE